LPGKASLNPVARAAERWYIYGVPRQVPDILSIIDFVANGNAAAGTFLLAFYRWVHFLDDVVDGDEPPRTPQDIVEINLGMFLTVAANEFFQEHREKLLPLVVQGARAWLDSERMKEESEPGSNDFVAAQVFKSLYSEVFWHTAFLTGGWAHMEEATRRFREVDYDDDAAVE
jgi:hypothetical protein